MLHRSRRRLAPTTFCFDELQKDFPGGHQEGPDAFTAPRESSSAPTDQHVRSHIAAQLGRLKAYNQRSPNPGPSASYNAILRAYPPPATRYGSGHGSSAHLGSSSPQNDASSATATTSLTYALHRQREALRAKLSAYCMSVAPLRFHSAGGAGAGGRGGRGSLGVGIDRSRFAGLQPYGAHGGGGGGPTVGVPTSEGCELISTTSLMAEVYKAVLGDDGVCECRSDVSACNAMPCDGCCAVATALGFTTPLPKLAQGLARGMPTTTTDVKERGKQLRPSQMLPLVVERSIIGIPPATISATETVRLWCIGIRVADKGLWVMRTPLTPMGSPPTNNSAVTGGACEAPITHLVYDGSGRWEAPIKSVGHALLKTALPESVSARPTADDCFQYYWLADKDLPSAYRTYSASMGGCPCVEIPSATMHERFYFLRDAQRVFERLKSRAVEVALTTTDASTYHGEDGSAGYSPSHGPKWSLRNLSTHRTATPQHYNALTGEVLNVWPCVGLGEGQEAAMWEDGDALEDDANDCDGGASRGKTASDSPLVANPIQITNAQKALHKGSIASAMEHHGLDYGKHRCWMPVGCVAGSVDQSMRPPRRNKHLLPLPTTLAHPDTPGIPLYNNHTILCVNVSDTTDRLGRLVTTSRGLIDGVRFRALLADVLGRVRCKSDDEHSLLHDDEDDSQCYCWVLLPKAQRHRTDQPPSRATAAISSSQNGSDVANRYQWCLMPANVVSVNFGLVGYSSVALMGAAVTAMTSLDGGDNETSLTLSAAIRARIASGDPFVLPLCFVRAVAVLVADITADGGVGEVSDERDAEVPASSLDDRLTLWAKQPMPIVTFPRSCLIAEHLDHCDTPAGATTEISKQLNAIREAREETAAEVTETLQLNFPLVDSVPPVGSLAPPGTSEGEHADELETAPDHVEEAGLHQPPLVSGETFAVATDPYGLYVLEIAERIVCVNAAHLKVWWREGRFVVEGNQT